METAAERAKRRARPESENPQRPFGGRRAGETRARGNLNHSERSHAVKSRAAAKGSRRWTRGSHGNNAQLQVPTGGQQSRMRRSVG